LAYFFSEKYIFFLGVRISELNEWYDYSTNIGSGTLETRTAMSEIAIENVLCGIKGEKIPHPHNA